MRSAAGRLVSIVAVGAGLAVLPGGPAAADTIRVTIEKMAFTPASISAHAGDTIEWVNKDFVGHTATAKNGRWDVTIPAGKTGQVMLKDAGDVAYFCRFHPMMKGNVSVAAKP